MSSQTRNALILSVALGLLVGIGAFTFIYAKGYSYLTNNPEACANCHVMNTHFDSWAKSSHHSVAVCNDCHTPHNFVGKYLSKASNGFWHSLAFTTGDFPDPLRIKPHNRKITEQACRYCHQEIVTAIDSGPHLTGQGKTPRSVQYDPDNSITCTRCHDTVGHWVR